jgi:RNA polymerase sigma factor (TIGR02999 family)
MADLEVTELLGKIKEGNDDEIDLLVTKVYYELRRLAGSLMRHERADHTLQPTALVHEAFVRLMGSETDWQNRAHFFGAAATAMRRILIEYARSKAARKRGGHAVSITLEEGLVRKEANQLDLVILDQALTGLSEVDPKLTRLVEIRYFAGCSVQETAEALGVSRATVKRDWTYAKAWLQEYMGRAGAAQAR